MSCCGCWAYHHVNSHKTVHVTTCCSLYTVGVNNIVAGSSQTTYQQYAMQASKKCGQCSKQQATQENQHSSFPTPCTRSMGVHGDEGHSVSITRRGRFPKARKGQHWEACKLLILLYQTLCTCTHLAAAAAIVSHKTGCGTHNKNSASNA